MTSSSPGSGATRHAGRRRRRHCRPRSAARLGHQPRRQRRSLVLIDRSFEASVGRRQCAARPSGTREWRSVVSPRSRRPALPAHDARRLRGRRPAGLLVDGRRDPEGDRSAPPDGPRPPTCHRGALPREDHPRIVVGEVHDAPVEREPSVDRRARPAGRDRKPTASRTWDPRTCTTLSLRPQAARVPETQAPATVAQVGRVDLARPGTLSSAPVVQPAPRRRSAAPRWQGRGGRRPTDPVSRPPSALRPQAQRGGRARGTRASGVSSRQSTVAATRRAETPPSRGFHDDRAAGPGGRVRRGHARPDGHRRRERRRRRRADVRGHQSRHRQGHRQRSARRP